MSLGDKLLQLVGRFRGTIIYAISPTGGLDVVELDVSTRRTHDYSGVVAIFPVEDGSDGADNYHANPNRLTVEGVLTDTPIQFLAGFTAEPNRAATQVAKLDELRLRAEHLQVFTDRKTHNDMLIESMIVDEDVETGDALHVTLHFVKAQILSIALVPAEFDLDALIAGAGGTADLGVQSTVNNFDYVGPTDITVANPF